MRKVIKFGGTSIGNPTGLESCLGIVKQFVKKSVEPIVVVSAFKNDELKFTDALIQCAEKVTAGDKTGSLNGVETIRSKLTGLLGRDELDPDVAALFKELEEGIKSYNGDCHGAVTAFIKSFGERVTARIFARKLNERGIEASPYDAYDLGMTTTDDYGSAMILESSYTEIKEHLKRISRIPVITGFIGKNRTGEITTFQRSGSDYTATIVARAVGRKEVDEVILYTDVEGLYSGNPIYVDNERLVRNEFIGFDVAEEGAWQKVKIPPGAIQPLVRTGIDLTIMPLTPDEDGVGTVITERTTPRRDVSFITAKTVHFVNFKSAEMATRAGFLSQIFACASKNCINIDLLSTTSTTVGMSVETESEANLETFVDDLKGIPGCDGVMVLKEYAQINIIGGGIIRDFTRILYEAVNVLNMYDIKIDAISTGFGVNVGFIMAPKYTRLAVDRLHYHLIEKKP